MTNIILGEEFHKNIIDGAKALCRVAVPNFGPNGRNTIADQKYDLPLVANSGRKILKDFELEDRYMNLGAVMLRDAALKVSTDCGDGSLATVVLADEMLSLGEKAIVSGANPILLKKGMAKAAEAAVSYLKSVRLTVPAEKLRTLAINIAKYEDVGDTVFKAISAVGADGTITVEDSQASTTVLNIWDGVKYDYGLSSTAMITDQTNKSTTFDYPYVLLINYKLTSLRDLYKVLEQTIKENASLIIIAQDVNEDVMRQLNMNVAKGILKLAVCNGPGFGDTRRRNMFALSAKTGAKVFEPDSGNKLEECGLEFCGRVEHAVLTKESTVLQGFPLEDPESVSILRNFTNEMLKDTTSPDEIDKLNVTLSILSGKIAEIIAGGTQEYEMFERKYLTENTVSALKAALKNGVLPGAGLCYLMASEALKQLHGDNEDEDAGFRVVKEALQAPMRVLSDNAGFSGNVAIKKALESGCTLYFNTVSESYENVEDTMMYDALDSVCAAVNTAASTVGTLLSATAAVLRDKKEE